MSTYKCSTHHQQEYNVTCEYDCSLSVPRFNPVSKASAKYTMDAESPSLQVSLLLCVVMYRGARFSCQSSSIPALVIYHTSVL